MSLEQELASRLTDDDHAIMMRAIVTGQSQTFQSGEEVSPTDWQKFGKCADKDPALFRGDDEADTEKAKGICEGCPVEGECLEFALVNGEKFYIWGRCTPEERRQIRLQRARARVELASCSD